MPTLSWDVFYRDHGAERGLKNLGTVTSQLHVNFGKAKVAAAALGLAAGAGLVAAGRAAIRFGTDSVRAYNEAQVSQNRLADAFDKFPRLADTNQAALQRLNSELAKKTRFDDDATASGQAVLAQFKLTGTQITQLTPLLQDYAAKTGKDLPTAAKDLGRAVLGQGRALKTVGIDFKDTGTAAGNLEQITEGLRTQVGGFAENEGKNASTRAVILKNRFGELQESIGQRLQPILTDLMGAGTALLDVVEPMGPAFEEVIDTFTTALGGGGRKFKGFTDLIVTNQADIITGFYDMGEATIGFGQTATVQISSVIRWWGQWERQIGTNLATMANFFDMMANNDLLATFMPPGFQDGMRNLSRGLREQADAYTEDADKAEELADMLGFKVNPALEEARARAKKLKDQAILEADKRIAAQEFAKALDKVSDSAKLSDRELRDFNATSGTGTRRQGALRGSLQDARDALIKNYKAAQDAGAKHDELNKIIKTGRQRLIDELIQMGFSKKRAQELADKYTNVKDEVKKIPASKNTKLTNNAGKDDKPRKDIKGYKDAIRDIPKTWLTKLQYDTSVDGINARLVQRGGRFAVQMSAGGSREDLARSPATMRFLSSGANLPNGFGGPNATTDGTRAFQRAGQGAVGSALRDAARDSAGPYGRITDGGAGRAAGIREGMRWASSGGTYPGHHPSMNKAWDFMISSKSAGDRIAGHLWANRQRLRLWYLIWNRRIISMTRPGAGWLPYFDGWSSNPNRAHTNHVHASWYDRGGMVRSGTAAINMSGSPERMLSPRQTQSFERLVTALDRRGSVGDTYITVNAPNVTDTNGLRRMLVDMNKRGELAAIRR